MIAASRSMQRPGARRHGVRVGVGLGVAALLLAGGGVAVAGGLIEWGPLYEDPDNVFAFTLASGRDCESRLVVEPSTGDGGPDQEASREVERSVATWLRSTDLLATLDLDRARKDDAAIAAQYPDQTIVIGPDGSLMDVPEPPSTRTEDDVEVFLIDRALKNALLDHIASEGVDLHGWAVIGGVKCEVAP